MHTHIHIYIYIYGNTNHVYTYVYIWTPSTPRGRGRLIISMHIIDSIVSVSSIVMKHIMLYDCYSYIVLLLSLLWPWMPSTPRGR